MAIATTITISAIVHNVYGLTSDPVQDADDYFGGRLGAASWTAATTLTKQQAIISAARFMDRRGNWTGVQTDAATPQALDWPRDSATCSGTAVTDGTIPDNIAHGEFELALALIEDESIQDSSTSGGSNLKRAKAGSAEVEFFSPTLGRGATVGETQFPTVVQELVGCYLEGASGGGIGAPYVQGTTETSSFDDCDKFDVTQGY